MCHNMILNSRAVQQFGVRFPIVWNNMIVSCSNIIIRTCRLRADEIYFVKSNSVCLPIFFLALSLLLLLPIGFLFAITSFGKLMSSHRKRKLEVHI